MSETDSGKKIATGCGLDCLVAIIIGGVLGFLVVKGLQSKAEEFAAKASSEPADFNETTFPTAEVEDTMRRFDEFRIAMANSAPTSPLTLTADDLNILVTQHPDFEPLSGKVQFAIEGDQLKAAFSVKPADLPINIPFLSSAFKDKYINGMADLSVQIKDERGSLFLTDLQLEGIPLPASLKKGMTEENMMEDLLRDPEVEAFLDQIDELKVEAGALRIIPEKIE